MEKILLTEPHRLHRKVADGSAVGVKEKNLQSLSQPPPLRSLGCLAVGDDEGDSGFVGSARIQPTLKRTRTYFLTEFMFEPLCLSWKIPRDVF